MNCIYCNAQLAPNAKFCRHCGKKITTFCSQCGQALEDGALFCTGCGTKSEETKNDALQDKTEELQQQQECEQSSPQTSTPVSEPQTSPVQAPVQTPVQAPVQAFAPVAPAAAGIGAEAVRATGKTAAKTVSAGKRIAIIAAVVAFLIGAVSACLHFFVPAPEDTVDKLIQSVETLNYDEMLSCFDSTTEKQIRATMSLASELLGAVTGFSMDLEEFMAFAPSLAPYMEIPDLGIANAETVLYADCSKAQILQYCETANAGGSIPTGYLFDNEIMNFLSEHNLTLPGLENLTAQAAVVKITLEDGSVGYLPMINEGWGDWRLPLMDLALEQEGLG